MVSQSTDDRIEQLISVTEQLKRGDFEVEALNHSSNHEDSVDRLADSLYDLAHALDARYQHIRHLNEIAASINAGLLLDEVLEKVYHDFRGMIPYDRIGFSLLEDGGKTLRALWAKSDLPNLKITTGYSAPMEGSSLLQVLQTGRPRIINDLAAYAAAKKSESSRLIAEEGVRSSLTCPLVANGVPVGFLFFSSGTLNAYTDAHIDLFMAIANQLSVIVEKSQLISELAKRQQEIEARNAELVRLSEIKNAFMGIVAHDLRSPLGVIQMTADMLLMPENDFDRETWTEMAGDIRNQTSFMLQLIGDLLDVTQLESGRMTISAQQVNVVAFVAANVYRINQLAHAKQTQVVTSALPELTLQGDPARLRQVLDNLLTNAVKFSPPGSTIQVRVGQQNGFGRIEVEDQGPGLTADDCERLFQPFARLSARPTGGEKSTGLGLAICKKIIDAHQGQIGVTPVDKGTGSIFWFTVPLSPYASGG